MSQIVNLAYRTSRLWSYV